MPCLKGLSYGKDESRDLSCGYRFSISKDVMKSDNLLHIQGFVDSLSQTTVTQLGTPFEPCNNEIPKILLVRI